MLGSLEVSSLGLGWVSMAGVCNAPQPKKEMIDVICSAVEQGVTFFDTAEVYGPVYSEEIVGEALQPFKGKVQIASKFGNLPFFCKRLPVILNRFASPFIQFQPLISFLVIIFLKNLLEIL